MAEANQCFRGFLTELEVCAAAKWPLRGQPKHVPFLSLYKAASFVDCSSFPCGPVALNFAVLTTLVYGPAPRMPAGAVDLWHVMSSSIDGLAQVDAVPASFDCEMRKMAYEYGKKLLDTKPFWSISELALFGFCFFVLGLTTVFIDSLPSIIKLLFSIALGPMLPAVCVCVGTFHES